MSDATSGEIRRTASIAAEADVIVVGAGVAGLAATRELSRHGKAVLLIEARGRLGGRLLSAQPPGWEMPVELGAEFVHGQVPLMREAMRHARLSTREVNAKSVWVDHGHRVHVRGFWKRMIAVTTAIPRAARGWSVEDFFRRRGDELPPQDVFWARHYLQSFNAAPADRLSAPAVRESRGDADNDDLRVNGRYDRLVEGLCAGFSDTQVDVRLAHVVRRVRWRRGRVSVSAVPDGNGQAVSFRARAAILTLPLGVLRARDVAFEPELRAKNTVVAKHGWGVVVRVVLRFKPGFWSSDIIPSDLGKRNGAGFGFVNAPQSTIPVWWAPRPPAPVLVGWAGGPVADRLVGRNTRQVVDAAVASLATIFGAAPGALRRWLADAIWHDWVSDPFTRGAYSYVAAGAEKAAGQLARPQASTLFFAGEATSELSGTVHGAIASGVRAAREVLKVTPSKVRSG